MADLVRNIWSMHKWIPNMTPAVVRGILLICLFKALYILYNSRWYRWWRDPKNLSASGENQWLADLICTRWHPPPQPPPPGGWSLVVLVNWKSQEHFLISAAVSLHILSVRSSLCAFLTPPNLGLVFVYSEDVVWGRWCTGNKIKLDYSFRWWKFKRLWHLTSFTLSNLY